MDPQQPSGQGMGKSDTVETEHEKAEGNQDAMTGEGDATINGVSTDKQDKTLVASAPPITENRDHVQGKDVAAESKYSPSHDNGTGGAQKHMAGKSNKTASDGEDGKLPAEVVHRNGKDQVAVSVEEGKGHREKEAPEVKGGKHGGDHLDSEAADADDSQDEDARDNEDQGAPTKEKRMPKTNRLYNNPEFVSGQAGLNQGGLGQAALAGLKPWVGAKWTAEEDDILIDYVERYGPTSWSSVAWRTKKPFNRGAEACKKRWSRLQAKMRSRGAIPPGPPSKRRRKVVPKDSEEQAEEQGEETKEVKAEHEGEDEAKGGPEAEHSGAFESRTRGDEEGSLRTAKLEDITKRGEKGEGAGKWGEDINRNLQKFLKTAEGLDKKAESEEGQESEKKAGKDVKKDRAKGGSRGVERKKGNAKGAATDQVKAEPGAAEGQERCLAGTAVKEEAPVGGWSGSGKPSIDLNVDLNDPAGAPAPGPAVELTAKQAMPGPGLPFLQGAGIPHSLPGASGAMKLPLLPMGGGQGKGAAALSPVYQGLSFSSHPPLRAIRPAPQPAHPRPLPGPVMFGPGGVPLAPIPSWLPPSAGGATRPAHLAPCSNGITEPDLSRNETDGATHSALASLATLSAPPISSSAPLFHASGAFTPVGFAAPPVPRAMASGQAACRIQPPQLTDAAQAQPVSPSTGGGSAPGTVRAKGLAGSLMAPPSANRPGTNSEGVVPGEGARAAGAKTAPSSAGEKPADGEAKAADVLSDHSGVTGTPSGSKPGGSRKRGSDQNQAKQSKRRNGEEPVSDVSEAATVLVLLNANNAGAVEGWKSAEGERGANAKEKLGLEVQGAEGTQNGTGPEGDVKASDGQPGETGKKAEEYGIGADQQGDTNTVDTYAALQNELESSKQAWGQMRAERQEKTKQKLEVLEETFSKKKHQKTEETLRAVRALWEEWAGECEKIISEQDKHKEVVLREDREGEIQEEELEQRWRIKQKGIVSWLERQLALAKTEPA